MPSLPGKRENSGVGESWGKGVVFPISHDQFRLISPLLVATFQTPCTKQQSPVPLSSSVSVNPDGRIPLELIEHLLCAKHCTNNKP